MKRYPMGPVEKAKKEMQKQMEEERAQMEKRQAKFETLIQRITEKFGEEGISLLKESGLIDGEISSALNFSTGTGSGS